MPKSLLPPKYIEVPVGLAFDKELSASIRDTAVQLSAFAWGNHETPPISIDQLSEYTGKKPSTLYEHMRILRDRNVLRWRTAGDSTLIISFSMDAVYDILEKPINIDTLHTEDITVNNSIFTPSEISESANLENGTHKRLKKRRDDTCPAEWMDKLYTLCDQDKAIASAGMRKRLSDAGKVLIKVGAQLSDLDEFRKNWYARDWRGRLGQPPKPEDIRNCWRGLVGKHGDPREQEKPLSPDEANKLFDPRL